MSPAKFLSSALAATLLFLIPAPLLAQTHKELGRMWTFENAPLDWFEQAYGFRPTQAWLDKVRLASLGFGEGGSASFVSPHGLILTNNHCAQGNVAAVTPSGEDWVADGFFAEGPEQEVRMPGLSVRQLVSMVDVTERVNEGLGDGLDAGERRQLVDENSGAIVREANGEKPELEHEVVALYQGGMYQLYGYKRYEDIRLVCAPPLAIAEFGGDSDNFTYPRFCLDFALARAYEDDKPADTSAHHLSWKTAGPKDGETVFVTGSPGDTGRLKTMAQMEYLRDVEYPTLLKRIEGMLGQVAKMIDAQPELEKNLRTRILMLENARKAYRGFLDGLLNPAIMEVKRNAEKRIRERVEADPELEKRFGDAWQRLEEICAEKAEQARAGERVAREPGPEESAIAKRIGEAFFAVYGTDIPPDATSSPRIADGLVQGFPYNGTVAPWFTSLYGVFARHTEFGGAKPFCLPAQWLELEDELDLSTPFNFVTTSDIIGGNSGSPLINTDGELVGLVFDGNIESLGNRFVFMDDVPRTVCVHPAIIIEALRKVYDRGDLADEIEGRQ